MWIEGVLPRILTDTLFKTRNLLDPQILTGAESKSSLTQAYFVA